MSSPGSSTSAASDVPVGPVAGRLAFAAFLAGVVASASSAGSVESAASAGSVAGVAATGLTAALLRAGRLAAAFLAGATAVPGFLVAVPATARAEVRVAAESAAEPSGSVSATGWGLVREVVTDDTDCLSS
jgi:hypothetical protein